MVGDLPMLGQFFRSDDQRGTESLYLDGYGLLLFTSVGFPLVAPAEPADQETDKPAQEVDAVWQEAKDELTRPPGQGKQRRHAYYRTGQADSVRRGSPGSCG